jgi:transposase
MTVTTLPLRVTAGVDTHLDVHVAAALDETGSLLGVESFATTTAGYRRLIAWLRGFGQLELVGIEGTGSYGAGLTRVLLGESVHVVEIDRPNRQRRRRRGKSDSPRRHQRGPCRAVGRRVRRGQDPGRKR